MYFLSFIVDAATTTAPGQNVEGLGVQRHLVYTNETNHGATAAVENVSISCLPKQPASLPLSLFLSIPFSFFSIFFPFRFFKLRLLTFVFCRITVHFSFSGQPIRVTVGVRGTYST